MRLAIVAGIVAVLVAAPAAAAPVFNDGSLLTDEFNGSSVNPANWTTSTSPNATITVSGGLVNLNSLSGVDPDALLRSVPAFNFSGQTEWIVDMRFRVNSGGAIGSGSRHTFLATGSDAALSSLFDFDVRLAQNANPALFDLAWFGYDVSNLSRVATTIGTGFSRGSFHDLRVYHKADNTVDVMLDNSLVANLPSLGGTPSMLWIGDGAGALRADFDIDYYRFGFAFQVPLAPEPGTWLLFGVALVSMAAMVWVRRHRGSCRSISC